MSNLFDRIAAADEKYANVQNSLFGSRSVVPLEEPEEELEEGFEFEEPGDFSQNEPNYAYAQNSKFEEKQIGIGREFMRNQGVDLSEFQLSRSVDVDDKWLRSLAKLKVASMNLKMTFKTEPVRLVARKLFQFVGKNEIAQNIKDARIDESHEEYMAFNELLEEVVFQEMKALQRANNLRVPPAEELMKHRTLMMYQQLLGDGYSNVIELVDAGYEKLTGLQIFNQPK